MTRIQPVTHDTADAATKELLTGVRGKLGTVPNLLATMAVSPAVAKAYLAFRQSLSGGVLPARIREQIALVVGQQNHCNYCLAAHTALGKNAGLTEREALDARLAKAADSKERAALDFSRKLVEDRGVVADSEIEQIRQAGYTDAEIAEIVANVSLNIFTNYFNHVAGTEIDFPQVPELSAA